MAPLWLAMMTTPTLLPLPQPLLSFSLLSKAMIKLWPSVLKHLTPCPTANGCKHPNPFNVPDAIATLSSSSPHSSVPSQLLPFPCAGSLHTHPSISIHHHLLAMTPAVVPVQANLTLPGPLTDFLLMVMISENSAMLTAPLCPTVPVPPDTT